MRWERTETADVAGRTSSWVRARLRHRGGSEPREQELGVARKRTATPILARSAPRTREQQALRTQEGRGAVAASTVGGSATSARVYGSFGVSSTARTVPCSTIRPSLMTATLSAIVLISARVCVTQRKTRASA